MPCTAPYQPFYSVDNPIVLGSVLYTNAAGTILAPAGYYSPPFGLNIYQVGANGIVIDFKNCLVDPECDPTIYYEAERYTCPGCVDAPAGSGTSGVTVRSLTSKTIGLYYRVGSYVYRVVGTSASGAVGSVPNITNVQGYATCNASCFS